MINVDEWKEILKIDEDIEKLGIKFADKDAKEYKNTVLNQLSSDKRHLFSKFIKEEWKNVKQPFTKNDIDRIKGVAMGAGISALTPRMHR
jgi:hypothetical protein